MSKCIEIVPMSWWDMAAGNDTQGQRKAIKTADGKFWIPTDMTPMQAQIAGAQIGYRRGNKICER